MARKLKVAVVGANWGLQHIAGWKMVPNAELVAVCTSRPETAEQVAREYGIPHAYHRFEDVLAHTDIDIVTLTTRPSIRAAMAPAVLEAGKHLLQPLPFAMSLAEGEALRSLAERKGLVAMVENLHSHSPLFAQAKELIENGFIGTPYIVHGSIRTRVLIDPPPGWPYMWTVEAKHRSSAFRNFGGQLLQPLTWLFGDVTDIVARIALDPPPVRLSDGSTVPNETADAFSALVSYASGAEGHIDTSWVTTGSNTMRIDAAGTEGRIVLEASDIGPNNGRLLVATRKDEVLREFTIEARHMAIEGTEIHDDADHSLAFPLAAMCYRMAHAVSTGDRAAARPTFDDAYKVMRTIEAGYASHDLRAWVRPAEMQA